MKIEKLRYSLVYASVKSPDAIMINLQAMADKIDEVIDYINGERRRQLKELIKQAWLGGERYGHYNQHQNIAEAILNDFLEQK